MSAKQAAELLATEEASEAWDTGDRIARDYLAGRISRDEAIRGLSSGLSAVPSDLAAETAIRMQLGADAMRAVCEARGIPIVLPTAAPSN